MRARGRGVLWTLMLCAGCGPGGRLPRALADIVDMFVVGLLIGGALLLLLFLGAMIRLFRAVRHRPSPRGVIVATIMGLLNLVMGAFMTIGSVDGLLRYDPATHEPSLAVSSRLSGLAEAADSLFMMVLLLAFSVAVCAGGIALLRAASQANRNLRKRDGRPSP